MKWLMFTKDMDEIAWSVRTVLNYAAVIYWRTVCVSHPAVGIDLFMFHLSMNQSEDFVSGLLRENKTSWYLIRFLGWISLFAR